MKIIITNECGYEGLSGIVFPITVNGEFIKPEDQTNTKSKNYIVVKEEEFKQFKGFVNVYGNPVNYFFHKNECIF